MLFHFIYPLSSPRAQVTRRAKPPRLVFQTRLPMQGSAFWGLVDTLPFSGVLEATANFGSPSPKIGNPIIKKIRIARKQCEIKKKLLQTTYRKMGSGFQNPWLFWWPCQLGWAKLFTTETASSIKQQKFKNSHCLYHLLWTLTTDVSWYCKLSTSQLVISSLKNNIPNRIIQVSMHVCCYNDERRWTNC